MNKIKYYAYIGSTWYVTSIIVLAISFFTGEDLAFVMGLLAASIGFSFITRKQLEEIKEVVL